MTVTAKPRTPFGMMFTSALVLSWTLVTAGMAGVIWAERDASPIRLATWTSLWAFTVLMPTLNALTVHRVVRELGDACPDEPRPLQELARLRPLLLLSANMALLSAFALIFGR